MDDGQAPPATAPKRADPGAAPMWRIARASIEMIMDMIEITRGAGSVLDPLIVSTVLEGNLALFNQDPELQRRYAEIDRPPPDELRRPISIAAVAGSLSLPYETVRRRAGQLVRSGALAATPKGLTVPAAALATPAYLAAAVARYERLKRFYLELKQAGVTAPAASAEPQDPALSGPPVRLVNRIIGEYMLRVNEQLLRRVGDAVSGILVLELGRANAEHLDHEARRIEAPLPDDLRRPVSLLALARRLRLPPETVRRHVLRLEAEGLARKVRGGWLAEISALPRGGAAGPPIARNLANVGRLLSRLASLGVVAYWEAEAQAGGPAWTAEPPPG